MLELWAVLKLANARGTRRGKIFIESFITCRIQDAGIKFSLSQNDILVNSIIQFGSNYVTVLCLH